jgi:hypothetical protein
MIIFFMKWKIYNKCSIFYLITEFIKGIVQTNINKLHRIDGWKLFCFLSRVWFLQNYRKVKAEAILICDLISAVSLLTNNCFRYTNDDLLTSIVTRCCWSKGNVVDRVLWQNNKFTLYYILIIKQLTRHVTD